MILVLDGLVAFVNVKRRVKNILDRRALSREIRYGVIHHAICMCTYVRNWG